MNEPKKCTLCGAGSEQTAIFVATYAGGELNICLECLAEGIKECKPIQPPAEPQMELPFFDETPEEVYGEIKCTNCGQTIEKH